VGNVLRPLLSNHTLSIQQAMVPLFAGKVYFDKTISKTVNLEEIVYLQSIGNYTIFHFSSGKQLVSCRTMKYHRFITESNLFVRIHKSFTINKLHVNKIDLRTEMAIYLTNNRRVSVSRRKKREVCEFFQISND
jgi:DNA-binding LytR/AlgR family response regulator